MIPLIWSKTPMPARIVHSTKTMTTPAMPSATDSRNEIFIADHGSTRETVSRTRRADAGRAAGRGAPVLAVAPSSRPDAGRLGAAAAEAGGAGASACWGALLLSGTGAVGADAAPDSVVAMRRRALPSARSVTRPPAVPPSA